MAKFSEIKRFTEAHYHTDVPFDALDYNILRWVNNYGLQLDPDFQRAHVWTEEQQIKFVEYFLKGGVSGKDFYFNHPGWMTSFQGEFILVDGKQRLEALNRFLNDRIPAFGNKFSEYTDKIGSMLSVRFFVNNLRNRAEVLQWYIDLNSGVAHTPQEIEKVQNMLERIKK